MEKKLPRISIITPSFNQAQYIEKTIHSVLSQNYPFLDYIIIDGGSTDGTLKILKKYTSHLRWYSQKDNGQTEALNKGLKIATGDVIGYLNSDDILEKGSLSKIGHFFQVHPEVFWVTGKCQVIDSQGRQIRGIITFYKNLFLLFLRNYKSLLLLNYISQPATFWRKEIFAKIGFFNDKYQYSMDYEYWLRIWKYYSLAFLDYHVASFRVHQSSKGSKYLSKQLKEGYNIASHFTNSSFMLFLHRIHDFVTFLIYKALLSI